MEEHRGMGGHGGVWGSIEEWGGVWGSIGD